MLVDKQHKMIFRSSSSTIFDVDHVINKDTTRYFSVNILYPGNNYFTDFYYLYVGLFSDSKKKSSD